jgi:hypothetical protein
VRNMDKALEPRLIIRGYVTVGDMVLIGVLVALAIASFLVIPGKIAARGAEIEIRAGERVAGRYSLDTDRTVEVEGPLGKTVVEIRNGHARIVASPCPHKLCTRMGQVGRDGGFVACVPNRVVVCIAKQPANGLDAVTR